MIVTCTLWSR